MMAIESLGGGRGGGVISGRFLFEAGRAEVAEIQIRKRWVTGSGRQAREDAEFG